PLMAQSPRHLSTKLQSPTLKELLGSRPHKSADGSIDQTPVLALWGPQSSDPRRLSLAGPFAGRSESHSRQASRTRRISNRAARSLETCSSTSQATTRSYDWSGT